MVTVTKVYLKLSVRRRCGPEYVVDLHVPLPAQRKAHGGAPVLRKLEAARDEALSHAAHDQVLDAYSRLVLTCMRM